MYSRTVLHILIAVYGHTYSKYHTHARRNPYSILNKKYERTYTFSNHWKVKKYYFSIRCIALAQPYLPRIIFGIIYSILYYMYKNH